VASDYTGNVADTLLGANRLIPAGTKHFSPVTSRSNKVQAGALDRINATSPLGSPTQANPLGAQKS
jgi:hypothetical protein